MKKVSIWAAMLLILGIGILYLESSSKDYRSKQKHNKLPWNIQVLSADRVKVLGLEIGQTSLADAHKIWDSEFNLGLFVKKGELKSLVAFFDSVRISGLSSKIFVEMDMTGQPWQDWVARYAQAKAMPDQEVRYSLSAEDYRVATQLPVILVTYVPAVNLDEDVAKQRFGQDYELLNVSKTIDYWLYPAKGLAIRMDKEGKELLRYAPPARFESIRQSIEAEKKEVLERAKKQE